MKKVLLVSALFPPQMGGTSEKMGKRVKFFSRFGWHTVVLTPSIPKAAALDKTLTHDLQSYEVHRTPYLFKSRWPSLRHDKDRSIDVYHGLSQRLIDMIFVPKGYVRWLPYALQKGLQLAREVDVILTMNNPITLHFIGLILHTITRKPWVIEIRDPIVGYAYGRRGPEKLNLFIEKLLVNQADAIIQRADFVPDLISGRYPQLTKSKLTVIPYTGFDTDDFKGQAATQEDQILKIVYTGNFYGDTITPIPFLKSLKSYLTDNTNSPLPIMATFAGDWKSSYDEMVSNLNLESAVQYLGWISREKCITLWQDNEVLLLILSNEEDNLLRIPSKFWDYVGAQKPILALVPQQGRLAGIIQEQNLGVVADPEDIGSITQAIGKLADLYLSNSLKIQPDENFLSQANRANSERQVIEVLNKLI